MANSEKLVVLTGASRGLGRAMLGEFAARGWTVAGCARASEALSALQKDFPNPHQFEAIDVADAAQVQGWAARVANQLGAPALLVNNAALINRSAPLWELSAAEFDPVIDVNIKGVANVIRAFLPAMIRERRGVIVNFSSGWGRSTSPEVAPYCATKWAVEGLTQAFAQEIPAGLAAVALNPGIIDTRMLRSCFGESSTSYPKPEAWAKIAVPYLLGLGPRHNGQSLTVPGA